MADYSIEVTIPNQGPKGDNGGIPEAPEDGIIYGRKDAEWEDITAPANLQVRRGTAAEVAAITPLEGEPVWETDTKKLVVGDGSTQGGISIGEFPISGGFATEGAVYVSGAGVSHLNGIYLFFSVINGKPAYQNNNETNFIIYESGSWLLVDPEASIYQAQEEVSFPWEVSQWESLEEQYDPPPSVLQGSSAGKIFSNPLTQSVGVSGNSTAIGSVDLQLERSAASQIASGEYSAIIAGRNNTASGKYSIAMGEGAVSHRAGMVALGHPATLNFNQMAQSVEFGLRVITNDDTPILMRSGVEPTDPLPIPNNTALFATIEIIAIESVNATEAAHFIRKFAIKNVNESVSLIGEVTTIGTDYKSDESYAVNITTSGVSVTGDEAKSLRWTASVRGTEIAIA
jgi:hypothetical protein